MKNPGFSDPKGRFAGNLGFVCYSDPLDHGGSCHAVTDTHPASRISPFVRCNSYALGVVPRVARADGGL